MNQNRSTAVMQRRIEPADSLDYFPTPPWATRALCEWLRGIWTQPFMTVWEPACGEGHMARPLGEYFSDVFASDVHDYRATYPEQDDVSDFLISWDGADKPVCDWVITNPPFRLAKEFIETALETSRIGVAVLVRTSFVEGKERFQHLFSVHRPAYVLQFVERVAMFRGRLDKDGASATSYCWIVWTKLPITSTQFDWIAPCRARLERHGDYPEAAADDLEFGLFSEHPEKTPVERDKVDL